MAYAGDKASTDPSVAVDRLSFGDAQLVKLLVPGATNESPLPGDAVLGLYVAVQYVNGPLSSGAPVTTEKPVLIGGRSNDGAPIPADTVNDATHAWFAQDGALNVYSRVDGALLEATTVQPTATGYVAGDVVGNVLTFNGAALGNGRGGTLTGAEIIDKTGTTPVDMKLALYAASPTSPAADSALFSTFTVANRVAAKPIATVKFDAANFVDFHCDGQINGGPFAKDYYGAGTAIYGILYWGAAAKTAADGSFYIGLTVQYN